jgi:glycosyltransferase involved in cell wall biosynthesis
MTMSATKKRVLFVPDSLYWITATIAGQICRHNKWIEPTIHSPHVLQMILDSNSGTYPGNVDLVHFLTPYGTSAFKPAFYGTTPWVVTIHHIDDRTENELMVAPAGDADAIMTVCHQWHNSLISKGVPSDRCVMVPNGIEIQFFRPVSQRRKIALRKKLGIPEQSTCVGFSGKRSSDSSGRKGISTLTRAMQSLAGSRNINFAIMGPGWDDLVHDYRARGGKCIYMPFLLDRSEVADFYNAIDLYWVTSRIEGGPVPLLEAMSCGATCISTPVGAAIDAISDKQNGFIAPFDDPDFYVALTRQLNEVPNARAQIGRSARETIVSRFNEAQTTQNVSRLYEIADANFVTRRCAGRAAPSNNLYKSNHRGRSFTYALRRRAMAEEHLLFFDYLMREGANAAAARIARRAIASDPLSVDVWKRASPAWPRAHRLLAFGRKMLKGPLSIRGGPDVL